MHCNGLLRHQLMRKFMELGFPKAVIEAAMMAAPAKWTWEEMNEWMEGLLK